MKKDTAPFVWRAVSFLVWGIFILCYLRTVTLPPQNSAELKRLGAR
ncbi:hypothetical protein [Bacillus pseudomycoides]|nr:hypothetical protein [Bacillus pseudomycoides]